MNRPRFRYIDDVTVADAAFEAFGRNLPELFAAAAEALFSLIVDLNLVALQTERAVTIASDNLEGLLYDWLSELVYLKDVHRELYSKFEVDIEGDVTYQLRAKVRGETIDQETHQPRVDVKAVTYHLLQVEKREDYFRAVVVVDL